MKDNQGFEEDRKTEEKDDFTNEKTEPLPNGDFFPNKLITEEIDKAYASHDAFEKAIERREELKAKIKELEDLGNKEDEKEIEKLKSELNDLKLNMAITWPVEK